MDISKRFKRNEDRTVNGAKFWLDEARGVYIKVARMHPSNPQWKKNGQAKAERYQADIERVKNNRIELDALMDRIGQENAADVLITGWEGIEMDGAPLEYSVHNAHRIKNEVPELFEQLVQFALDSSNYVGTFDEEASLKNSQTASLSA